MSKSSVLVQSPTRKCAIDFKVRGKLSPRAVKLVGGQPSVRVGNTWHPVVLPSHECQPVRLTVARNTPVPGMIKI